MNRHLLACLAAAALAGPVIAQTPPAAGASAEASTADMTAGEIRKVDKDTKRLTIKHGEIRNLDMPPMTMVFRVKDAAVLDKFKAGDKVRFTVEKAAAGYVVTDIRSAP